MIHITISLTHNPGQGRSNVCSESVASVLFQHRATSLLTALCSILCLEKGSLNRLVNLGSVVLFFHRQPMFSYMHEKKNHESPSVQPQQGCFNFIKYHTLKYLHYLSYSYHFCFLAFIELSIFESGRKFQVSTEF